MTLHWFAWLLSLTFFKTSAVLCASAALLIFCSFGPWTRHFAQSFRGIVAPFFGAVTLILGILIGFLANDIWERDRSAAAAVRTEADSLVAFYTLVAASDRPSAPVAQAIRAYANAVATQEWPLMAEGESAPEVETALDELLRNAVLRTPPGAAVGSVANPALDHALLDTAMRIRTGRNTRLSLSQDESGPLKWVAVLTLAIIAQVSLAAVHLEKVRPQIAAMTIFTVSLIFVIGLLAAHDVPFMQPPSVSAAPILHVLDLVPSPAEGTHPH